MEYLAFSVQDRYPSTDEHSSPGQQSESDRQPGEYWQMQERGSTSSVGSELGSNVGPSVTVKVGEAV